MTDVAYKYLVVIKYNLLHGENADQTRKQPMIIEINRLYVIQHNHLPPIIEKSPLKSKLIDYNHR